MSDIIRRLKCNQPVKSESGGKKFVVRACQGGQELTYPMSNTRF